jgi:hypothetical protein
MFTPGKLLRSSSTDVAGEFRISSEVITDTLLPLSDISVVIRDAETEILSSSTTICAKISDGTDIDNSIREKHSDIIFIKRKFTESWRKIASLQLNFYSGHLILLSDKISQ